jgi:hypothetical protein
VFSEESAASKRSGATLSGTTPWQYGAYGRNFRKTIRDAIKNRDVNTLTTVLKTVTNEREEIRKQLTEKTWDHRPTFTFRVGKQLGVESPFLWSVSRKNSNVYFSNLGLIGRQLQTAINQIEDLNRTNAALGKLNSVTTEPITPTSDGKTGEAANADIQSITPTSDGKTGEAANADIQSITPTSDGKTGTGKDKPIKFGNPDATRVKTTAESIGKQVVSVVTSQNESRNVTNVDMARCYSSS